VETTGQVRDPQTERTHALHSALLAGNAIEMLSLLTAHLPSTSLGAWRLHMFGIAAAVAPMAVMSGCATPAGLTIDASTSPASTPVSSVPFAHFTHARVQDASRFPYSKAAGDTDAFGKDRPAGRCVKILACLLRSH
jgi:hypothetical protein